MIRNQEILIDNLLGQHKEALTWSMGIPSDFDPFSTRDYFCLLNKVIVVLQIQGLLEFFSESQSLFPSGTVN